MIHVSSPITHSAELFLSLPNTIERYVGLSGQVASYLPNQFEQFTQR